MFNLIASSIPFLQIVEGSLLDTAEQLDATFLINRGIAYAIIAAGLLSVVYIFFGGISFILSGGDEEKIKQAVGTIRYAIIGLVITILAVIIVNAVGQIVGLNPIQYMNFNEIISIIQNISNDLSSGSSSGVRTLN